MAGGVSDLGNGRYRLRYRRQTRNIRAKSKSEATRLLAKFVIEVDSGDFSRGGSITFKAFAEKWLKEHAKPNLQPKTIYRYTELLESRIYPAIGNKKLDKIKPLDLLEFYNGLRMKNEYISTDKNARPKLDDDGKPVVKQSDKLSETTITRHHSLISSIFNKAVEWGIYNGLPPTQRICAPKAINKKVNAYCSEYIQKLFDTLGAVEDRYLHNRIAATIALMTAARLGEVTGLKWKHVDFKNGTLRIEEARQYLPSHGVFQKSTKNESSYRIVGIHEALVELLEQYRESQREKCLPFGDDDYLFISADFKMTHPGSVGKWFKNLVERAGLPDLTFHGLRHSGITYMIDEGVSLQDAASIAGHANIVTIQKVYSHYVNNANRSVANVMGKFVKSKEEEPDDDKFI